MKNYFRKIKCYFCLSPNDRSGGTNVGLGVRSLAVFALFAAQLGLSQAQLVRSLPSLASEPATEQSSYEARILKRHGVHDVDPNVYVYTPEFAKRFQLPMEWASDELKGADAVAFRVVPSYKTCGWGGDPNACREDEVRCDMDVYFDRKRNPLPWDERMREVDMDRSVSSLAFIGNIANPFTRYKGNLIDTYRAPFTDPKTGKELGWQSATSMGVGWTGIRSYDREIFQGISLVTFGVGCGVPRAAWLAGSFVGEKNTSTSKEVLAFIALPPTWQIRVKQALSESDQHRKAFFKQQGEKALKALQEQPEPNKPITPIQ
jgi:hypothetical protein